MAIKISSLKRDRREGKAEFTYEDSDGVKTEAIPISFLKPTEALWDALTKIEKDAASDDDSRKGILVKQLLLVEVQSTAIVEDDGRPHNITEDDLQALDLMQLSQLHKGVVSSFFLQIPASKSETVTNSSFEQAAS